MVDRFYSCEPCYLKLVDKILVTDTAVYKENKPALLTIHPLTEEEENCKCQWCWIHGRAVPAKGWIDCEAVKDIDFAKEREREKRQGKLI